MEIQKYVDMISSHCEDYYPDMAEGVIPLYYKQGQTFAESISETLECPLDIAEEMLKENIIEVEYYQGKNPENEEKEVCVYTVRLKGTPLYFNDIF